VGAARVLRQARRQETRLLEDERAVRQRERLLRDHALGPLVAFRHAGAVEERQEAHLLLRRVAEIEAAARELQAQRVVEVGPAAREIELARNIEDAVADALR